MASLPHAGGIATSTMAAAAPAAEEERSPHHRGLSLTLAQADSLLLKYVPESGGCSALERIALGFNNISYVATPRAGAGAGAGEPEPEPEPRKQYYVIRATKDTWPAEKVECEMACIRLMRSATTLPVPLPLCWDASAAEFGCRWIVMEKMPGRVMEAEEFDALPEPRAAALVGQMVGFLEQLQALRWEETGSFYPRGEEGAEGREAVRLGDTTTCKQPFALGCVSPRWRRVFQGRTSTASTGPSAAHRTLRTGC